MEEHTIYIRMRHKVGVVMGQKVTIGEIAQVVGHPKVREEIISLSIHHVVPKDKHLIVIDVMKVINEIRKKFPNIDVQTVGPAESILEISHRSSQISAVYFVFIWFLLFIGAALAIMNFHTDVSMQEVHQKIFTLITSEEERKPLFLQIPYSIGLGLGMILFFNHVFKKRLNEEPSPLEIEMHQYQQAIDDYVVLHENSDSEKNVHGD